MCLPVVIFAPLSSPSADIISWEDNVVAPPAVLLLPRPTIPASANPSSQWSSAIRLRNGDVVFIAKDIQELALVNNNLYLFQTQNLYYYDNAAGVALFLTFLVPGYAPIGLGWQYVRPSAGVELDSEGVLIHTTTCVLRLWSKATDFWVNPRISIVAGHCYESTLPRDGLPTFARFTQIKSVTTACSSTSNECGMLVLDGRLQQRLALMQGGQVQSTTLVAPALAISLWGTSTAAVAWVGGGFSLFDMDTPQQQQGLLWGKHQKWFALSVLDATHVFALSQEGQLVRFSSSVAPAPGADATPLLLGLTPFQPVSGHTLVALDFPYGLYVLDIARQAFYLAPNLGCLCPPGFAASQIIESQQCQPAPAGGYVDVLGRFVACPPGTFGQLSLATAQQTCVPCPPSTISNRSQSTQCVLCPPGTLADPSRAACVRACPPGTHPMTCTPCPIRGQTFDANHSQCMQCPTGMYTDPEKGQYTCAPCPGPSPPCPYNRPASSTLANVVMTIAMLGVRPVDMAVSRHNGTVYIAAFQALISIGHSGNALEVILPEFALVRGIALGPDERVLYAAVTHTALLCVAFADMPRLLRKWYWAMPSVGTNAVLVGVRLMQTAVVVWDAASNSLLGLERPHRPPVGEILAFTTSDTDLWIMYREPNATGIMALNGSLVHNNKNADSETTWSPHMALWQGRLMLSSHHALLRPATNELWGQRNLSGRVDADTPADARFTRPGPMAEAPDTDMLLVADQNGLRLLFSPRLQPCPETYYHSSSACWPCPEGWSSMQGSRTCTACTMGQFTNPKDGACVPCPRLRWWVGDLPCAPIVDNMVAPDASGLTLSDMMGELLSSSSSQTVASDLMFHRDYVSLQTLVLPVSADVVLLDAAAHARFWTRAPRVTPLPEVFVSGKLLDLQLELELPGFWVACSAYVLEIEPCTCQLPAGGIQLGTRDMRTLWNRARARAAAMDYSTLLVTQLQLPERFNAYNNSMSSTSALFVARVDAGGGTSDNKPSVLFFAAVDEAMSVSVLPTPTSTPSQSAFAACVVGWPATYTCPVGFLWVPPLFTCVPCRPGFYFLDGCVPCPQGSFSPAPASTACILCPTARAQAQSACSDNETVVVLNCPAGSELRRDVCVPCLPGYSKPAAGSAYCTPCAPGQYAGTLGQTACIGCALPLVSMHWGASACAPCPIGSMPSPSQQSCTTCVPRLQFFANGTCVNKTVFQCNSGSFLEEGGAFAENQCLPCTPCAEGKLMVPFLLNPCQQQPILGMPYRCVPLLSVPGQFSRLSINEFNSSAFDVQYTPCQGLPLFASWTEGPSPAYCFFQCNYAIMGPSQRQYLFYYSMQKQDAQTQAMLHQQLPPNVYPLDYPGLAADLMLLANHVCMPCPNTPCPWGKWRPLSAGCGPPVCTEKDAVCQVMEAGPIRYDQDGCVMNCTFIPSNAHVTGPAPLGLGDACPWECNVGFYMEGNNNNNNSNETSFLCLPCSPAACRSGTEVYHMADCLPTSQRSDFCSQCPTSNLAVAVPGASAGECQYACQPNISFQSALDGQCHPCPKVTCPAGHRLICAEQPCAPCPPLPMGLWSSAVTMPSSTGQCQAACRDGFHTLDLATRAVLLPPAFSYDPTTILCAPCIQRPTLACPARTCPIGYFMPTPGSGLCVRCPTDYDCALGQFPSSCICTQCPTVPVNYMPILASQARALLKLHTNYSVTIRCAMVCTWNTMLLTAGCVPCSTFNTPMLTFYSVWNASNGTRWWSATLDPPHLPPRSSALAPERRAGLCWPCPPGTLTSPGDEDLCLSLTPSTISTQVVPSAGSGVVFSSAPSSSSSLFLMSSRQLLSLSVPSTPRASHKRRNHQQARHMHPQPPHVCPPFATGVYPDCHCNPGFTLHSSLCVFEQRCSANHHLALALFVPTQADARRPSLRLVKHALQPCPPPRSILPDTGLCSSSFVLAPMHKAAALLAVHQACSPGFSRNAVSGLCVPCPRGTYSPHFSMSPCMPCPPGTTTAAEQSLVRAQCVLRLHADVVFVLP